MVTSGVNRGSDIQELLAHGMGENLHWFPSDVTPARLATVLAGMANTRGGNVLIGISPRSGQVQGVGDIKEAMDRVFQAALLCEPLLVIPMPRIVQAEQRYVLWITIPAGLPHIYNLEGRYLGREGVQTNPLPARRLRQLLMERGVTQFEAQVPPMATVNDLDGDKVSAYLQAIGMQGSVPMEEVLEWRGCLRRLQTRDGQGRINQTVVLQPNYAALLLFGRHPQQWLPGTTILAARFSGTTLADSFIKQEIAGTLTEQIQQAEAFVRANMRSSVRLVGLRHEESSEYPIEAVRELLVNAVAHRDYNLQGDPIHLNIYSDRLEVHSPGKLPGPVNIENLLEVRFSRNVVIMQVLSDLGYVERLGYGLNRVVEVMRQRNLRLPRFEEVGGTFRVTLFGGIEQDKRLREELPAIREMSLNARQELALSFLLENRRITNREYQELCPEVHAESLRRDLADLVQRGLLIKVGDKRATYYILRR